MLVLKAELLGVYKANDFVNKDSNETTIGKTKLQLMSKQTMQDNSVKRVLLDVSIPNSKLALYPKEKIGKVVEVDVAIIGKVTYYGI